jgi:hypothetical protein
MTGQGEPTAGPGRPLHVRRSLVLLIPTLLGLAVVPWPQLPASASCAAPYLQVDHRQELERGTHVAITGQAFVEGCRDTMGCTEVLGCTHCEYDEPPETPLKDVRLRLVQGDRKWGLGVVDAETAASGHLGRVWWAFEVPVGARPGPARLFPDGGEPARVRIR